MRRLLQAVLDLGCVVAWLGSEGTPLADPPDLFDPVHMTGGALAGLTSDPGMPGPGLLGER